MPNSLLILPLDVNEFLSATQGQTPEKIVAYIYMQIHYLRHGPIPNTAEALARACATPSIDVTRCSTSSFASRACTWSIDAQSGAWRHSRLDAWIDKCKKAKEKACNAIAARWGKNRASDAHTPSTNAPSIDTPSKNAQFLLDKGIEDRKAMERKEHARKAAVCRWSRITREDKANHAQIGHTPSIKIEHPWGSLSPSSPPYPPINQHSFTQRDTFPLQSLGDPPPPPLSGGMTALDGQHRAFRPLGGVGKAKPPEIARRASAMPGEDAEPHLPFADAVAGHKVASNRRFKKVSSRPKVVSAQTDEKLRPLMLEVWEYWRQVHRVVKRMKGEPESPPPRCPWGPGEDEALASLVRENSEIDIDMLRRMLIHMSKSEGINPSERPRVWLRNVMRFYAGPLDRFGKPFQVTRMQQWAAVGAPPR